MDARLHQITIAGQTYGLGDCHCTLCGREVEVLRYKGPTAKPSVRVACVCGAAEKIIAVEDLALAIIKAEAN